MTESLHTPYLCIGGGMAADAAIRALLKEEPDADITLITEESTAPYARPPLSKGLLTDPNETGSSVAGEAAPYANRIRLVPSRRAVRLDVDGHEVEDSQGDLYRYDKLLLATGGRPRHFPEDEDSEGVLYYRTLQDLKELEVAVALGYRVCVVGGGPLGMEVAASLAETQAEPFMIHTGRHLGDDRFPDGLARKLDTLYQSHGVDLLPEQRVTGASWTGDTLVVKTDGGGRYAADKVVAGLGIDPNTGLAESAGLAVGDGIEVNEALQTSDPDVFAAGDNASIWREALGRRVRVEHEQNATSMGEAAARSMAGRDVSYDATPLFYSDFFDCGYEALGDLNADLDMVEDWEEPHEKGVVYYLDTEKRPRGVLFWNREGDMDAARLWLSENGPQDPAALHGLL